MSNRPIVQPGCRHRRIGAGFVITLGSVCLLALWYLFDLMARSTALPLVFARHLGPASIAAAAGLGVAVLLAIVLRRRVAGPLERWAPRAFALTLTGLAVYAWFFRFPVGKLAWHDAMGLRTFAWYVTTWGLVAAVPGLATMAWTWTTGPASSTRLSADSFLAIPT